MSIAHLTPRRARSLAGATLRLLALLVVLPVVGACGGGDGPTYPGTPPATSATVQASPALQFNPGSVDLAVGGTVTFEFGAVAHNLFFDDAPPNAPANITAPTAGQSVTRTFTAAGRYIYNCHIHPGMTGTINVR